MTDKERQLKAKLPGADTGITIRHSVCDICTPGPQCGLNVYVKDGEIIKVEGTPGFPSNNGKLCTKGASNRQYVYRKERIKSPMKRKYPRYTERGAGSLSQDDFEPISWEEAYDIIEKNLKEIREKYSAESVAWFTGYTKWLRPWLRRLCNSFGGHNYMTESSTCFRSGRMANETIFGRDMRGDNSLPSKLVVAWGSNAFINAYPAGRGMFAAKEKGAKFIVIDVRHTQAAEKMADLFLQPHIGTDAVLAHAIANIIIQNNWQDQSFIDKYVHGFNEYKEMVSKYDLDTAERITGVPKKDIQTAAEWIGQISPASIAPSNGITHHTNGYNTHSAIMCLNVILGNVDKPGGLVPVYDTFCDMSAGFSSYEEEFMDETRTEKTMPQVGEERFPLWNQMTHDGQTMDLPRHILEKKPYEIHALAAFGVNTMIFPDPKQFRKAMQELDFIFATDLIWTDACSYADVVLPVCSSLERSEVKVYPGGNFFYTSPAIDPLSDSTDDVSIMTELARRLCPEDELLCSGYDKCIRYMFRDMEDEILAAKGSGKPYHSSHAKPYVPGTYLANGAETPTGKLELYSERIAKIDTSYGLNPLPEFYDNSSVVSEDIAGNAGEYPFTLMTGARLPHTIHSRGHKVPWLRSLRPDPMVDINPEDAARLGISQGDPVKLYNAAGEIHLLANVTIVANVGELHLIHGYEEANGSDLISSMMLDPYTGFPSYKQVRCAIEKEVQA